MITIGEIESADLKELSVLLEELSGEKTNYDNMTSNFNWMKSNADYILLGAKSEGKLVGTIMGIICRDMVRECRPFMVIENVVVSNSMKGNGIGKKLMKEVEQIGREKNCYFSMFVSMINKKEAHKFYESIGYSLDTVQGFKKYL